MTTPLQAPHTHTNSKDREWKQTDGQTDTTDCFTFPANASVIKKEEHYSEQRRRAKGNMYVEGNEKLSMRIEMASRGVPVYVYATLKANYVSFMHILTVNRQFTVRLRFYIAPVSLSIRALYWLILLGLATLVCMLSAFRVTVLPTLMHSLSCCYRWTSREVTNQPETNASKSIRILTTK